MIGEQPIDGRFRPPIIGGKPLVGTAEGSVKGILLQESTKQIGLAKGESHPCDQHGHSKSQNEAATASKRYPTLLYFHESWALPNNQPQAASRSGFCSRYLNAFFNTARGAGFNQGETVSKVSRLNDKKRASAKVHSVSLR